MEEMYTRRGPATAAPALSAHLDLIDELISRGGPRESVYEQLDRWMIEVYVQWIGNVLSEDDIRSLRSAFGNSFTPDTMQGFAFCKPHGYAGDYEIIDRIYRYYIAIDPDLARWDEYWQSRPAAQAVRNRKSYFHALLDRARERSGRISVLKLAVGPGRSMFEWLERHPTADVRFECVEIDPKAISYAARLNRDHLDRIDFVQRNALRYQPTRTFDLVWAAGLFDYFNDRLFVSMIRRLLPAIAPGGEMVIGNFSDTNPSRPYMELLDWVLHHRSREHLVDLAMSAGVAADRIRVGQEPSGVNLFLHISG
jgi:SAM-dependent methyltransferase